MMKRLFLAMTLCVGGIQGSLWDSVTSIFGPGGQSQQGTGLSAQDRLQILNSALESNTITPDFRLVLTVERGNTYLDLGMYQVALSDFNSALARKPEDKEVLFEALAGQAKALLALGKTDQYLATRTILINMAPPGGYPTDSETYYLVTFPDLLGGPNWWRNPGWRAQFNAWLHDHPHHGSHVTFSNNNVNVIQKPRVPTVPSNPQRPVPVEDLERSPNFNREVDNRNFDRPDRPIERPLDRSSDRPQGRQAAPAGRPSFNVPDRLGGRPSPFNR